MHCHDDLGLAVANSLAAVQAGARQIECTINGIGERAGNCSLEEVVMALRTREAYFGLETGIQTQRLYPTSKIVTNVTGMHAQRNKAIVGDNAFAHEAGIHQHGMLQNSSTYEIMRPEDVGLSHTNLVLGKHSGRHAFRERVDELGFESLPQARFAPPAHCTRSRMPHNQADPKSHTACCPLRYRHLQILPHRLNLPVATTGARTSAR